MNQVRLWQALGPSGGADARIVTWKSTWQQGRMSLDRVIWLRAPDPKDDVKKRTIDDTSIWRCVIFAQHDSDGSEAPQGRCSRIALFTFGPCSDHTSEVKSTRKRAASHLLCGHRRLIVSFSSRRVLHCTSQGIRGAIATSTYNVIDSMCIFGICIRGSPSTDGGGNMETCWHQVEYILRCVDEASCGEEAHIDSVHFFLCA